MCLPSEHTHTYIYLEIGKIIIKGWITYDAIMREGGGQSIKLQKKLMIL